jgi:hypothetical protein
MLLLLLANLYHFLLLSVAGLPSAVDVCDVTIVSAAVVKCTSCEFLLLLLLSLLSLLNVAVFSTVADCTTVCSGGPTADDIHDVTIVSAAVVKCTSCEFLLLLLLSLLNVAVFSTVADCIVLLSVMAVLLLMTSMMFLLSLLLLSSLDFDSVPSVVVLGIWTQKNYRLLASAVFS